MDVIIVGAGPTGMTVGAVLARRGHRVVAFDPDRGPAPDRRVAAAGGDAVRAGARVPAPGAGPVGA